MSKLPRAADPRKVLRALQRLGFVVDHVSGSHYAEHGDIPCDSPGDARCARGIPGSLPRPLAVGIANGVDKGTHIHTANVIIAPGDVYRGQATLMRLREVPRGRVPVLSPVPCVSPGLPAVPPVRTGASPRPRRRRNGWGKRGS